jgi:hypothetical protein
MATKPMVDYHLSDFLIRNNVSIMVPNQLKNFHDLIKIVHNNLDNLTCEIDGCGEPAGVIMEQMEAKTSICSEFRHTNVAGDTYSADLFFDECSESLNAIKMAMHQASLAYLCF